MVSQRPLGGTYHRVVKSNHQLHADLNIQLRHLNLMVAQRSKVIMPTSLVHSIHKLMRYQKYYQHIAPSW